RECSNERNQERAVQNDARSQDASGLVLERVLRRVADEAARVAHLVHDGVAGVDARRTRDALVLQALADVDPRRADLNAPRAVDAVTEPGRLRIRSAAARSARLAALCVVRDDQRVTVEHRALEARVRTHVLADLLAEIPRVAVRGKTVEQRPEGFPGADRERRDAMQQLLHGSEVADEREPGPQAETDPEHLLERLARELAQAARRRVELQDRKSRRLNSSHV